jgi:ER lumen protein retaining receptor
MQTPDDLTYNKPRTTWRRYWLKYRFSIICYFGLLMAIMTTYHFLSDGDFSFLMTLGSMFVLVSFALLVLKVWLNKNVAGISLKTLQAYALVFAARLSSILVYEGYLPYDRSGDWFYQATEVLALALVIGLVVAVTFVFNRSYGRGADSFGAKYIPPQLGVVYLVAPALLLAILLHPSLNGNWLTDVAWTFALYLEAVAILPQLYMFQKAMDKEIEPFTANFVFLVAVARMMHFVFWLSSFHELNDKYATHFGGKYPGHLVLLSQMVNLLLMGDYIYYYMASARSGKPVLLPQTI